MKTARRRRLPDPVVEGAPQLALRDEDREDVAELLAELLLDALEADVGAGGEGAAL